MPHRGLPGSSWAGYVDTGAAFTQVSGDWKQPTITCNGDASSMVSFWVGLGGYSGDSIEQAGTGAECFQGILEQYTWREMYPGDFESVGSTVAASDSISASVVRSGTKYTLKVTDSAHPADSFSTAQACSGCDDTSAEWITSDSSGYPLARFNSWTLTSSDVAAGGPVGVIGSYPDTAVTMTDGAGNIMAEPGPLTDGGSEFTDTWERSS